MGNAIFNWIIFLIYFGGVGIIKEFVFKINNITYIIISLKSNYFAFEQKNVNQFIY